MYAVSPHSSQDDIPFGELFNEALHIFNETDRVVIAIQTEDEESFINVVQSLSTQFGLPFHSLCFADFQFDVFHDLYVEASTSRILKERLHKGISVLKAPHGFPHIPGSVLVLKSCDTLLHRYNDVNLENMIEFLENGLSIGDYTFPKQSILLLLKKGNPFLVRVFKSFQKESLLSFLQ